MHTTIVLNFIRSAKAPQMSAGMRENQSGLVPHLGPEGNEIDIDRPRLVHHCFRTAAKVPLHHKQLFHQRLGRLPRNWSERNGCIDEQWGRRRAIHRRRLPQERLTDGLRGKYLQLLEGTLNG
jgi:hypothetical protein